MGNNLAKNDKTWKYGIAAGIILWAAFIFGNSQTYVYLHLAFAFLGLLIDPCMPLIINIICVPIIVSKSSYIAIALLLMNIVPLFWKFIIARQHNMDRRAFFIIVIPLCLFLFSYLSGTSTSLFYYCKHIISIANLAIIGIYFDKDQSHDILRAFLVSGFLMLGYVAITLITGRMIYINSIRLTFEGNVRNLATALVVPGLYYFSKIFSEGRERLLKRAVYIGLTFLFVGVHVLTYSRGSLLAVAVGMIIVFLPQLKNVSFGKFMLISMIVIATFYGISHMNVNTELMMGNLAGGNGRTTKWSDLFQQMKNNGWVKVLFGFGPGDTARIFGYYAHSTIMDYLFGYGIIGFCYLLIVLIYALVIDLRSKNVFAIGLFVTSILCFLPYGDAANVQFHVLVGIAIAIGRNTLENAAMIGKGLPNENY